MECAIMEEGTDGNGNRDDTSVIMMGIEEREENMMKSRDNQAKRSFSQNFTS